MRVRVGDMVQVITGDDRGARHKVLKIDRAAGKVVVENVNRVFKHLKKSQKNPQGGRLSKEMPVQISNVMLVCPSCSAASRMGARTLDDGSKERYCKRCNASVGEIAPPKNRS